MSDELRGDLTGPDSPHFSTESQTAGTLPGGAESEFAAWTEVEKGRFMPRRVRGSYHGRALG